jgi:hypothetical protein
MQTVFSIMNYTLAILFILALAGFSIAFALADHPDRKIDWWLLGSTFANLVCAFFIALVFFMPLVHILRGGKPKIEKTAYLAYTIAIGAWIITYITLSIIRKYLA